MDEPTHPEIEEVEVSVSSGSRKRDMFLPVSILIAAVMVGGAIVFATLYKGGGFGAAPAGGAGGNGNVVEATSTATDPAAAMTLGPRDAILGAASATVTLIEYGDYQCPYCGRFFSQTESQIIQDYVNTGKVRFVFRNLPLSFLGPESIAAAEAADCAEDQNKLWAYHDALYSAKVAEVAKGGTEGDGFFSVANLLKFGQQVGLNMKTFTSCVNNDTDGALVTQETAAAVAAVGNSTPSFLIDGQLISGAQPYSVFQAALDAALKG
jgi:protein-disulfide isomerase